MSTVKKILDRGRQPAPKPVEAPPSDEAAMARFAEQEERYKRKIAELESRSVKAERAFAQAEEAARKTAEERDAASVRAAVVRAANARFAVDPDDVADLLARRVALRDGRIVAVDDPEKDVDAIVTAFLETKPHYVRSQASPGTGAPPVAGRPPPPPAPANHDLKTREGATAAMHEGLLATINKRPS